VEEASKEKDPAYRVLWTPGYDQGADRREGDPLDNGDRCVSGADIAPVEFDEHHGKDRQGESRSADGPRQPCGDAAAHPTDPSTCSLVPSITTLLYSTTVSQALRLPLRSTLIGNTGEEIIGPDG
jgi:hypothetical protein